MNYFSHYIYKYIKVIPLTISSSQDTKKTELNTLLSKIEEKFTLKEFCSICLSVQDLNVTIKINKKRKY